MKKNENELSNTWIPIFHHIPTYLNIFDICVFVFFPFYSGTILEHLTLIYIDLQIFTIFYNVP
jgi:hypothetical protein